MAAAPIKLNLKVYQGSTFSQVLRWESSTKMYAPITNISKSAPMVVTSPAHSIPIGWRARITNVAGMKEANTTEYNVVTDATEDTVVFNQINALAYSTYTSGGVIEYNKPHDLTGYSARMQLREKVGSENILFELTTSNGLIQVDTTLSTITLTIPALATETFSFKSAVYSLEIERDDVVTAFAYGNVSVVSEVTR